jgi:hypothetical protein
MAALRADRLVLADIADRLAFATRIFATPEASQSQSTIGGHTMWLYANSADR